MAKLKKIMFVFLGVISILFFGLSSLKPSAKINEIKLGRTDSMSIRMERGSVVVDYLDSFSRIDSLNIGNYDIYGILNDEGDVRFYIADIFEDEAYIESQRTSKVVKAMIYNKDEMVFDAKKPIILELTYYNIVDSEMYTIEKTLSRNELALLTRFSENIKLGDDEVSDRLRASMNTESSFRSHDLENYDLNEIGLDNMRLLNFSPLSTSVYFANKNKTVLSYNNDTYTEEDYYIDNYLSVLFNANYNNGIYSDDYITKMVPKFLFFAPGVHSYVGKELGFSLKVTQESTNLYIADAFIYDIDVTKPGNSYDYAEKAIVEVKPAFQFRYYARRRGTTPATEWNKKYASNLNEVVYKHTNYDAPNYYLKDIQVKLSTTSLPYANPGDPGYSGLNDTSDNFNGGVYYYNGEGKTTGRTSYDLSVHRAQFGTHDMASKRMNDPYLSGNVVLTHYNYYNFVNYNGTHNPTNQQITVQTHSYFSTLEGQHMYFGHPFKAVTFYQRTAEVVQNENPLLIGTRTANNYVKVVANLDSRGTHLGAHENELHVSIAADFVSDDTYYQFIFFPAGQITVLDTAEGSYNYGNYSRAHYQLDANAAYNFYDVQMTYEGQISYFTVVTTRSSKYVIQTYGSQDTTMELINAHTGEVVRYDDDSGSGRNAKIELVVNAGDIYYLKVKLFSKYQIGNYQVHINYAPKLTLEGPTSSMVYMTEMFTAVKLYIPEESYYRFTTLGNYATWIELRDENGNFLTTSDYHPERVGENGMVDWYFEHEQYILVVIIVKNFDKNAYLGILYRDNWK